MSGSTSSEPKPPRANCSNPARGRPARLAPRAARSSSSRNRDGTPRGCRSARSTSADLAALRRAGSASVCESHRRTRAWDRGDRLLRELELRARQRLALFLEVGLAEVAANDRVRRGPVRRRSRCRRVLPARSPSRILVRPRPSRASGLCDSNADGLLERRSWRQTSRRAPAPRNRAPYSLVLRTRHAVGTGALRRLPRPVEVAEREPELGQPRPGARRRHAWSCNRLERARRAPLRARSSPAARTRQRDRADAGASGLA